MASQRKAQKENTSHDQSDDAASVLRTSLAENKNFRNDFMDDPLVYSPDIWNELRIFLSVAKNKSFNAAATKLGVSQPTVSRAVKQLESTLRQKLTISDQRGIKLTQKGLEIATVASKLDHSLSDMTLKMRKTETDLSGLVHVSCTEGLAAFWLVPKFASLCAEYPLLSVNIKKLVNVVDLERNDTDMMIVFAPDNNSNNFSIPLGKMHFTTFCSHAYIDRHGMPKPDNLQDHFFIQSETYLPENGPWHAWNDLVSRGKISHSSNMSVSYAHLCKHGAGIAYLVNYVTLEESAVPLNLGAELTLPMYLIGNKSMLSEPEYELVKDTIVNTFHDSHWFNDEFTVRPAGARRDTTLQQLFNNLAPQQ